LLEDEGLYNRLRQKAVQYVYVVSEGQIVQPKASVLGQVKGEKIYMFCFLDHHHYPLKYKYGL
jgi:hypothetical protein